jgi:hypothetical protein
MLQKKSISSLLILLIGILIISYISTKATISSFTHDESYSYTRYVHTSFMDILTYKIPFTNNHILNTLLMKFFESVFGSSELALRIPNIILLFVFLFYIFLFFKKDNEIIGLCMFVFMCSNFYLMDFFGLARGYGLSIGFMSMSLYHLLQSFQANKNRNLLLFNIGAFLSVLSNFVLLYFYLAALVVYNIYVLIIHFRFLENQNKKYNFLKINWINFISFVYTAIVIYEPLRKIHKYKIIDFGGTDGFMKDTVTSLIYKYFNNYIITPSEILYIKIVILIPVILSFFLIVKNLYQAKKEFFENAKELIIVNLILLIIPLETIVQHYLLNSNYLVERFALFLFPLFVLNIAFLIDYWLKIKNRYRIFIFSVAIILALLSVTNFYKGMNLNYCADWGYDAETKNAVKELIADHNKVNSFNLKTKIGINWLFEPAINFYRQTWDIDWLQVADRNGLTANDDYCYIFKTELDTLKHKNYTIIFSSDKTKTALIRIAGN